MRAAGATDLSKFFSLPVDCDSMFRAICLLAIATAASGQQGTPVKSRSNVKDNLVARVEPTPDGRLKCTGADGKPCTSADLRGLDVAHVKAIAISDGILHCDGKPCTAAHLPDINRAVASRAITTKGVSGNRTSEPSPAK
jgi:hypothetical protein